MIETPQLKRILEAVLLAAGKPLPIERLEELFTEDEKPERAELQLALDELIADCAERGYELKKVASGYRFQVRQDLGEWVSRLWEEKPQRYSRALMETLSIIAYRQPITRGDIEKIRGVAVSTQIVQTLLEHEWVRVVGHRDVPGRPAMYATTRQFLDYFNLESLEQLPALAEIRDLEEINRGLALEEDKPVGRMLDFALLDEGTEEVVADEAEQLAAAIGTRPISEILQEVDNKLGLGPDLDVELENENVDPAADGNAKDAGDKSSNEDGVTGVTGDTCEEVKDTDSDSSTTDPGEEAPLP